MLRSPVGPVLLLLLLAVPSPVLGQASTNGPRTDRFGAALPEHALVRLESPRLREIESAKLQTAGRATAVAFSPDGKLLVCACENHLARF
jgi:hypothetical protein